MDVSFLISDGDTIVHQSKALEELGARIGDLLDDEEFAGVDQEDVKRYSRLLLEAATHLKEVSVVHRDIKPDNILLSDSGLKLKNASKKTPASSNKKKMSLAKRKSSSAWTPSESVALEAGVKAHGASNWAEILKDPKFATPLKGRSNKDLSDMWRALTPKTGKTPTKAKSPATAAPKSPAKSPVKSPVKKTPAKKTPVKKSPAKPVTPTRPPSARRAAKAATPKAKAVAPEGGVTKKTPSKTVVKSPAKSPAKPAKKKEGGGFCMIM